MTTPESPVPRLAVARLPQAGHNVPASTNAPIHGPINAPLIAPIRLVPKRSSRVYLAGPDVFERDSGRTFTHLSQLAHSLGLSPIVPMEGWGCVDALDNPDSGSSRQAQAQRIFAANIARLDSADGVLANLRDFRGSEPDSGTVFEVGYAFAKGIPVVGYGVPQACYANRVGLRHECTRDELGVLREAVSGCQVEDFGQRLNLMLAGAVAIEVDPAAAMRCLMAHLQR